MSRSRSNFLAQLERAQFIAFSPFIFQAAAAALRTGLLETLSRSPGQNVAGAAAASGLTPYAAGVLIDILATAGILEPAPNEGLRGWKTTPVGDLLIYDEMTRANFFFTADTCWPGLDRTEEALKEGKPAGLAAFNPSWKTIYPHLPELPAMAQRSWFRFDHYHSDRAYAAAIEAIREFWAPQAPARIADIGGNTGRFTKMFLEAFPDSTAVLVDLPVEVNAIPERSELSSVQHRLSAHATDWLTSEELTGMEDVDLFWMSQFLDCFSLDEAASILERTRRAMKPGAKLCVLEPLTDEQRHQAAALSLAASSLYFTVLANGVSRFFHGAELRELFKKTGFRIIQEKPNMGVSHTLFLLEA
ncbi:methyltransferase [Sutterella wadsworthensis]|uniref:methyltransferase n=1 Tax=Sutterella wadsworthensis TaxID=40545 RepID=UPI003FF0DFFF